MDFEFGTKGALELSRTSLKLKGAFAMHAPNLDALFLTPKELAAAKEEIKKMAFQKWQDAGSPEACDRDLWTEAQVEWLEHSYVPHISVFLAEAAA